MTIQRAFREFMDHSKSLYHQLRSDDGEALSDVELMALREQLHILDAEAGHLQELKEFDPDESPYMFPSARPHAAKQLSRKHG